MNKELFDVNELKVNPETVGEWDGEEETAAENFERITHALYDAVPDEFNDDQIYQLLKTAWDYWGSKDDLLTLRDEQITEYVERCV